MSRIIKSKKPCCASSPRCRRCPLVMKRLARRGLVERISKRRWRLVDGKVKKSVMRKVRAH